jgi:Fe-Mn family superoxide dismutase
MNRRELLATTAVAGAGLVFGAQRADAADEQAGTDPALPGFDPRTGQYVLPPLAYAYDALEPSIDAQTMRLHHDIHHAGYVRGLNAALAKLADAREAGDFALVKHLSRQAAFHGSGHFLHTVFWANMAPAGAGGGGEPAGRLRRLIEAGFGSVDAMRAHFSAAAGAVEGSGWGILAYEPHARGLTILQAEKHHNLTQWGVRPLLVLDVWEHAYYLKYQNRRGDYIKAFWEVVNWQDVAGRLPASA